MREKHAHEYGSLRTAWQLDYDDHRVITTLFSFVIQDLEDRSLEVAYFKQQIESSVLPKLNEFGRALGQSRREVNALGRELKVVKV